MFFEDHTFAILHTTIDDLNRLLFVVETSSLSSLSDQAHCWLTFVINENMGILCDLAITDSNNN